MTQQTNEIFHVIGTDLLDYSFKVEQAIKEGWTFSVENQYAPRAWPHMFEAFLVKPSESTLESTKDNSQGVDTKVENKTPVEDSKPVTKQVNHRGVKK